MTGIGIVRLATYDRNDLAKDRQGDLAGVDSLTLAMDAIARLGLTNEEKQRLGLVFCGSETRPYAVKAMSASVVGLNGLNPSVFAADLEFACKAGVTAMAAGFAFIKAGLVDSGLVIASDMPKVLATDALANFVAPGAAALLLGRENVIAEIVDLVSFVTDTPDFWRKQDQDSPEHAGRFTVGCGYEPHLEIVCQQMLAKHSLSVSDFDFVVMHQPNADTPLRLARKLGFTNNQIESGLVFAKTGNAFTATVFLGLKAVLAQALAGAKILLLSYGSGSGSEAVYLLKK